MSKKFKGFKNIRYPVYTVVTPQSGDTYSLRTLNVSEVMTLRESLTSGNKMAEILNDILWKAVEFKPEHISSKTEFLKNLTMKDRDALIYGLYHSTFGDEKTYNVVCGECSNTQKIKVSLNKIFFSNNYPASKAIVDSYRVALAENPIMEKDPDIEKVLEGSVISTELEKSKALNEVPNPPDGMPEEIARTEEEYKEYFTILDKMKENGLSPSNVDNEKTEKIVTVKVNTSNVDEQTTISEKDTTDFTPIGNKVIRLELPLSKGLVVYIKEPVLIDEQSVNENLAFTSSNQLNLAYDTLSIKKIEEYEEGNPIPVQIVDDRIDIVEAYQLLPILDRNEIVNTYTKEFGQYEVGLKANWVCRSCNENNQLNLDILQQFFRAITGS